MKKASTKRYFNKYKRYFISLFHEWITLHYWPHYLAGLVRAGLPFSVAFVSCKQLESIEVSQCLPLAIPLLSSSGGRLPRLIKGPGHLKAGEFSRNISSRCRIAQPPRALCVAVLQRRMSARDLRHLDQCEGIVDKVGNGYSRT